MKTPIERVVIFSLAISTHPETAHGGPGTVIGNILNDSESRPAVGAVGKWVAIAPVARGENLFLACLAGGNVRRDQLVHPLLSMALPDLEASTVPWRNWSSSDFLYSGHRRSFCLEFYQKFIYRRFSSFNLNLHTPRSIAHPASQAIFMCQPVNKGSEANPLYHPTNIYPQRLCGL